MQSMYGKVGMSRFLSIAGVAVLCGGVYFYIQSTRSKSVLNTALFNNCLHLVKHHPTLRRHLGTG